MFRDRDQRNLEHKTLELLRKLATSTDLLVRKEEIEGYSPVSVLTCRIARGASEGARTASWRAASLNDCSIIQTLHSVQTHIFVTPKLESLLWGVC